MAELNANAEAQGLAPAVVVRRVTVKPLTEAEDKAWDDEQAAAKAAAKAAKAAREEKRR